MHFEVSHPRKHANGGRIGHVVGRLDLDQRIIFTRLLFAEQFPSDQPVWQGAMGAGHVQSQFSRIAELEQRLPLAQDDVYDGGGISATG